MAICNGCGAPIVWVKMHTGKMMPCDPDKQTFVVIEKEGGQVYKGHVPHWHTCPYANQFRMPKKGRGK